MWDVPHLSLDVVQACDSERHGLDSAGRQAEVDRVADAVLVLGEHEEPGEEIAHHLLTPNASAAPTIEAPATSALTFTPNCDRIVMMAIVQMTAMVVLQLR